MRRRFFPPNLRDQQRNSIAAQRVLLAGMDPNDPRYAANKARLDADAAAIPAPRTRTPRPDIERMHAAPLEKDILKACLEALRRHPRVAFVGRFNRGVMQSEYRGRESWVNFNTVPGFPDIHGMLRGGRAFYIEIKRPLTGKLDATQSNFLAIIRACGGIAGVATSVEEALAILGAQPAPAI